MFSHGAYVFENKCIDDYYFDNGLFVYHVVGASSYETSSDLISSYQLSDGFIVKNNSCYLDINATELNISLPVYNFLMGLSGILAGFVFFFSIVLVMKRS